MLFSAALLVSLIAACRKTDSEHLSKNGETKSHNMGRNCMDCHYRGGPGEVRFHIAGTVYDSTLLTPLPNGKVEFYDALSGGKLVLTLDVDGNGNYYTANSVNFGSGLYPRVVSPNGNTRSMGSATSSGECASCHGNTQPKIWVEN